MEEPLRGGNMTAGVVRAGDTVRRPSSPASPFVARLLTHLARSGFDGSPRHLGVDGRGRDVLSYIAGDTFGKWRNYSDEQVAAAARLLRGMHDASRDLAARIGGGAVVCHHDPGPHNAIFRAGVPVAFVDFDLAAVGDPLADVAYVAWSWCVASKPTRLPAAGQARQVRVVADAYGLSRPGELVPGLLRRLDDNLEFWLAMPGHPRSAEFLAWTMKERAFVEAHRETFAAALTG